MARDPGRPPWPIVLTGEPWRSPATAGRCIGSGMPARARRSSNSPWRKTDLKNRKGPDSIAFSPDGTRVAYVSEGGKVQIWDVTPDETRATRSPDLILKGNWAIVSQVAWSADGRFVSASGQGGKIVTWQILAQDEHLTLKGTDEATWAGPTSAASANRFAAAFETKRGLGKTEIKVWDQAGQVLFQTTEPALDGPRISLTWSSGRAQSRRHPTGVPRDLSSLEPMGPKRWSFRFRVWDIATGRSVFHRDREETNARDAGFQVRRRCPQFRWTASGDDCGQRILIGSAQTHRFPSGSSIRAKSASIEIWMGTYCTTIVFSPDGRRVAGTSGLDPGSLRLLGFFESGMSRRARWS